MARLGDVVESAGRPLAGASVYVYVENGSIAEGSEDAQFTSAALASVYYDDGMTSAAIQPLTTNSLGEFTCYTRAGKRVALRVSRPGYGVVWRRNVDVLGTDPA